MFQWFKFGTPVVTPPLDAPVSEPSSSSSSSSDSTSESDRERPTDPFGNPKPTNASVEPAADELLVGQYRSVLHAMVIASDGTEWRPLYDGKRLRSACGRPMRASDTQILHRFSPDMQLCQHGACRKVWLDMHMA